MAVDLSVITNLMRLNLINQTLNNTEEDENSLSSLLSNISGSSLLSSAATSQQAVNISSMNMIAAAGALTDDNPLTVFTGESTQDAEDIENAVTSFVEAFNNAVDSLSGSSSAISQLSAERLVSLAEDNATALSAIGITIEDGKLVVDSTALSDAAANNQSAIQDAFNGSLSFAGKISSISRNDISQTLGLTSGAGFLAMYTSSLDSGISSLLSGLSLINSYL